MTKRGTDGATSPEGQWADGKAEAAQMLADCLHDTRSSKRGIGARNGLSAKRIDTMADPYQPNATVPLQACWRFGAAGIALAERALAKARGEQVKWTGTHIALLHHVLKETSEVPTTMAAAMADGHIDEAERKDILRQCHEAQRSIADVVSQLQGDPEKTCPNSN